MLFPHPSTPLLRYFLPLMLLLTLFLGEAISPLLAQTEPSSESPAPGTKIEGFDDWVTSLCWSPDGKMLACGSYEQLQLWSRDEQKVVQTFSVPSGSVTALCYLPDGRSLLAGGYQRIHKIDLSNGKVVQIYKGHRGQVTDLLLRDEEHFLSTADDTRLMLWNLAGKVEKQWENADPLLGLDLSGDKKSCVLAVGDETRVTHPGEVIFFDLESWQEIARLKLHRSATIDVLYSPDQKTVLSSAFDETVIVTDIATHKPVGIFKDHSRPVNCLASVPGTEWIVSGSGGRFKGKNELKIWKQSTGEVLLTVEPHAERISCLAVSPDGAFLATGSHDKTVLVWDLAPLKP